MEIYLKKNYGFELHFKADNVHASEDIETRTYPKGEDGEHDFKKPPVRDISTDALEQVSILLSDMINYRSAEFDSSDLIKGLFEKLPKGIAALVAVELYTDYKLEQDT